MVEPPHSTSKGFSYTALVDRQLIKSPLSVCNNHTFKLRRRQDDKRILMIPSIQTPPTAVYTP